MGRTWDNAIERLPHLGRNRCKNQMPPPGHSSPSCPTPLCRSRRFPLLSFPTFPPLLSFPTFLIGNPGVFLMQGHTNEKDKKNTGFPLKTCGNDREERPAGDDREGTSGHDRGETCRHDRRETCGHDRGTRRFRHSRHPPSVVPNVSPPSVVPDVFPPSVVPDVFNREPRIFPRRVG